MKDAYYFPHFCNARHDRKIQRMRKELGIEGYGIFFMLLEVLREQIDFKYPMKDIDLLAGEFEVSETKLRVVICNYQLFEVDETELFFSPKLFIYMQPYVDMKEQRRLAGVRSGEIRKQKLLSNTEQPLNDRLATVELPFNENEQSKEKESKEKESKVNKTEIEIAIDDFIQFRKKIQKPMTGYAVKLLITKLNKLASDDETKIAILNESILNSWQGIFPLKEPLQKNKPKETEVTRAPEGWTGG